MNYMGLGLSSEALARKAEQELQDFRDALKKDDPNCKCRVYRLNPGGKSAAIFVDASNCGFHGEK